MGRQVIRRIIKVHERTINNGNTLKHILQALAEVVGIAQSHVAIEDDVDLDVELVAGVVRLQALDLADGLGEAHRQVQQHVALVGRRRRPRQVPDVRRHRLQPVVDHVQRQQDAAQRVQPPDARVVADCCVTISCGTPLSKGSAMAYPSER